MSAGPVPLPRGWQQAGASMNPRSEPPPVSMEYHVERGVVHARFFAGSGDVLVRVPLAGVELTSDPNDGVVHEIRDASVLLAARAALPDEEASRLVILSGRPLVDFLGSASNAIRGHEAWRGYLTKLQSSMAAAYLANIGEFRALRDANDRVNAKKNFGDEASKCARMGIPEKELVRIVREEIAKAVLKG